MQVEQQSGPDKKKTVNDNKSFEWLYAWFNRFSLWYLLFVQSDIFKFASMCFQFTADDG